MDNVRNNPLKLIDKSVPKENRVEIASGWGFVLAALEGVVDFCIDLRNHDPEWINNWIKSVDLAFDLIY